MIAEARLPAGPTVTPDDIVREVRHLPSAPKVLPRLKQLLGDGNSAMHEIVALIRLDPGIAARVLQIGNSAYFSAGSRCLTVGDAVNRVGYEQVYQLVSYAVASQVLIRPLEVYGIESEELWRMSVAGALAAEVLAERTRQDRNIAYTVGLLHCVGMVAIDEWALHNARHLFLPRGVYPREAIDSERAVLGFTQAEVGGALLHHWGFPGGITEPVRWQYSPRASMGYMRMASLLSAAKWLRNTVCGNRPPIPEAVNLQPIGLTAAALDSLATTVERRLGEITELLEQGGGFTFDRDQFPAARWGN